MRLVNQFKSSKWIIYSVLSLLLSQFDPTLATGRECSDGRDTRIDTPLCKLVDYSSQQSGPIRTVQTPQQFAHLSAIAAKSTYNLYPSRVPSVGSLKRYDELPYPLPIGASLYFCTLTLVLLAWYVKTCVWAALHKMADTIELFPETQRFPDLNLYSLQQSKREARLRRETRNSWAWMANKYLLLPDEQQLNTDVFKATWSDFDVPRDVWGIVRAVMKVNAWFNRAKVRVAKDGSARPQKLINQEPFDRKKEDLKDRLEELKKDVDPTYDPHVHNLVQEAASFIIPEEPEPLKEQPPPRPTPSQDLLLNQVATAFVKPLSPLVETKESSVLFADEEPPSPIHQEPVKAQSKPVLKEEPIDPSPPQSTTESPPPVVQTPTKKSKKSRHKLKEPVKDDRPRPKKLEGSLETEAKKSIIFEVLKAAPKDSAASSHVEMPDAGTQKIKHKKRK